jgi:hypothetical protein
VENGILFRTARCSRLGKSLALPVALGVIVLHLGVTPRKVTSAPPP